MAICLWCRCTIAAFVGDGGMGESGVSELPVSMRVIIIDSGKKESSCCFLLACFSQICTQVLMTVRLCFLHD